MYEKQERPINYQAACYIADQDGIDGENDPRKISETEYNIKQFELNITSNDIVYHRKYGDVGRIITVKAAQIIISLRNRREIIHEKDTTHLSIMDVDYATYITIKIQDAREMVYGNTRSVLRRPKDSVRSYSNNSGATVNRTVVA